MLLLLLLLVLTIVAVVETRGLAANIGINDDDEEEDLVAVVGDGVSSLDVATASKACNGFTFPSSSCGTRRSEGRFCFFVCDDGGRVSSAAGAVPVSSDSLRACFLFCWSSSAVIAVVSEGIPKRDRRPAYPDAAAPNRPLVVVVEVSMLTAWLMD